MLRVEFSPNLKEVKTTNGKTRLILEIDKHLLKGCMENLSMLEGNKITASFQPETIEYTLPVNKQTKKPNVEYVVNSDGTIEMLKEEQTSLEIGDNVEEVENVTVLVSKETIDEFIKKATTLELPENVTVNVRDALIRLSDGDSLNDIAADHELSETALIDQIETARKYFAPFADTWSKHKDDIIFPEK